MGGRESLSSGKKSKNRIVTLTFFGLINLGQWMHDTVTRPHFTDIIQKWWGCQPKENLKFIIWPTKVPVSFIVSAFFTLPNFLPNKYFFTVIIFCLIWFLLKIIIKSNFLEKNRNRFKQTGFNSVFLDKNRFKPVWLGFF